MTVYIDVVLAENIAMNYIIMLACSLLGNRKVKIFKVFIASIIGGIYSIVNYFMKVSLLINIIFKISISRRRDGFVYHNVKKRTYMD